MSLSIFFGVNVKPAACGIQRFLVILLHNHHPVFGQQLHKIRGGDDGIGKSPAVGRVHKDQVKGDACNICRQGAFPEGMAQKSCLIGHPAPGDVLFHDRTAGIGAVYKNRLLGPPAQGLQAKGTGSGEKIQDPHAPDAGA